MREFNIVCSACDTIIGELRLHGGIEIKGLRCSCGAAAFLKSIKQEVTEVILEEECFT